MSKTKGAPAKAASKTAKRERWWTRIVSRPELLFVTLATVFGLITLIVMPPFMVPDENAHLFRSYQISEGGFLSSNRNTPSGGKMTGGILPIDLFDQMNEIFTEVYAGTVNGGTAHVTTGHFLKTKMNTHQKEFVRFDTVAVYSPFSYIPQTIGVTLGRIVYPSILVITYLGRLCNLAAFIVMLYFAIRLIPLGKWLVVVAGLLPMTLQQAASLSSDVTTIGLAFLSIAYFLHLWYAHEPLRRKQIVIICALGALLGLTKQTNLVLVIPYLFLPNDFFASFKRRLWFCVAVAGSAVGAALAWYVVIKLKHFNLDYSMTAGVDMAKQTKYVEHHPIAYGKVLLRTFVYNTSLLPPSPDFYWESMVGVFSWIRYQLPVVNVVLAYVTLTVALLASGEPEIIKRLTARIRWAFALTFAASVLAIGSILYLIWTPVGAPVIAGIQGRYFLPLLPLLIPVFATQRFRLVIGKQFTAGAVFGIALSLNFITMMFLTHRFFHGWL